MQEHSYNYGASYQTGAHSPSSPCGTARTARRPAPRPHEGETCSIDPLDRGALFAEFLPLVSRLIRQYGKTDELRQDLPGELYCFFHALLDSYDPQRGVPLRAYLVRQLTASAFSLARKQWRRCERETSLFANYEEAISGCEQDPTPEWDLRLLNLDIAVRLPSLIQSLPQRQRQVVICRYYENRSFEEIAQMLTIETATVRSLLRHGLNKIRGQMAPVK